MLTRLERRVLTIPSGLEVTVDSKNCSVSFKKSGEQLTHRFDGALLTAKVVDNVLIYEPIKSAVSHSKKLVASHLGTAIAISDNHIQGLTKPFVIDLVLKGTGYKVALKKQGSDSKLVFNLGKSHEDEFVVPSNGSMIHW